MKHRKKQTKLSRTVSHRRSLLSNISSSLILNEYAVTTLPKAKAVKSYFDKVASLAVRKKGESRRRLRQLLKNDTAVDKLVEYLAERFEDRVGGFTTLVRMGRRKGDNAQMAKLILIGSKPFKQVEKVKVKKEKKKEKKEEKKKKDSGKKGFLSRVRGLGRGSGQETKDKLKTDQTEKKEIRGRSRSGI